jgi:endoglucanase
MSRPAARLHVNQLGYLADGPMGATLVTGAVDPVPWRLLGGDGTELATGRTLPWGDDATAGEAVHVIDVPAGAVGAPAAGLRLEADGEVSPSFAVGGDLYAPLLADALRVFTLQRSGVEIGPDVAGPAYARAAGHVDDSPHGGDGAARPLPAGAATTRAGVDLYDGWTGDYVVDGRGGWYDAGDQGKYVVNAGISVAQLLGLVERSRRLGRPDGPAERLALDEARFELDWMLRMQVAPGLPLAGLVHHKLHDEHWTGLPTLPADDPQRRFAHRPSTAATLNLAAVAAQGARVLATDDPAFAARLFAAARTAYDAAHTLPVLLAPDTNVLADAGGGPYDDVEIDDERYWAAVELFLTTGEARFATELCANPYHLDGGKDAFPEVGFDWRDVSAWARMQLATVPSVLPERREVRAELVAAADAAIGAVRPFGHLYAPAGDAYAWGSNGMVANRAAVVAAAYEVSGDPRHRAAALAGIDYLLGRNALGLSYVTGYGASFVRHQHSRWYAGALDPALPDAPHGTLSGGPNSGVQDDVSRALAGSPAQRCYVDDIGAWAVNEMTINWNAALAWLVAFAVGEQGTTA